QILRLVKQGVAKRAPATGLAVFRIGFGLVVLQEVVFLYWFRHLIFDPVPYVDMASPVIHFLLLGWAVVAVFLVMGYHTRFAAVVNYLLWIVFVVFTPMWQDFDGGFDQLMIGSSFLLMFLPTERALSLDKLRKTLKYSTIAHRYVPPTDVSVLCYYIPVLFSLGLLYFDSAVHKLWAEFWRNGMGAWLPATMPYYMSGIDLTWVLNNKPLQAIIGYALLIFQFVFVFLCCFRAFRVPLLLIGLAFHIGIILALNIYPFGFGMLVHYALMVPFAWWGCLGRVLQVQEPTLTVFYDEQCPLCNRTVITVQHFDVCKAIAFRGLQTHARQYRDLDCISDDELLKDIYGLDRKGRLYLGLHTYVRIFIGMRYLAPLGWLMRIPGIYHLGRRVYRHIADHRARLVCDESCTVPPERPGPEDEPFRLLYERYIGTPRQLPVRVSKFLVLIIALQLNSTIHYGIVYRLNTNPETPESVGLPAVISNAVLCLSHTFLGITPHALYMHDHFAGYEHLLGLTYRDQAGRERWLPFVNEEGRLVAPNWGRVQSMWANVAVTARIKRERLYRLIQKVTLFWGKEVGLDVSNAEFTIKLKKIRVPMDWERDLRHKNISQPWQDIGKVIWKDGGMRVETRGIDIEGLSRSK
ncbi:MAG: DCC1-like thiol-disulfide oxidoreductase family protein, partial [Gammaproteobacteria bacterium]